MVKLLIGFVVAIAVAYIALFQPYVILEENRLTAQPVTVKTIFVNVTGDPLCAKLYKLDESVSGKLVASKEPLYLALPQDIPSPEDGAQAYSDNLFIVTGYPYEWIEKNRLTGATKITQSYRFDVIAWEIVAPYKIWAGQWGEGVSIDAATAVEPISHRFDGDHSDPGVFVKRNYVDCLQ